MARKRNEGLVPAEVVDGLAKKDQWELDMASEAKDAAAKEVSFAPRVSFKGGRLKVAGVEQKDNVLDCIVVDAGFSKAFYEEDYDEDNPATPACYAFGRAEADLKPHPQAPKPQADSCATCKFNKFGTSDRGKGKACKDERRLMLVPSDTKPADMAKAEVVMAIVPPTSLKNWGSYVKTLAAMGRTPWSVLTRITVEPLKSYFQLMFEPTGKLDGLGYAAVKARQPTIESTMFAPYPTLETEEAAPKAKRRKKLE